MYYVVIVVHLLLNLNIMTFDEHPVDLTSGNLTLHVGPFTTLTECNDYIPQLPQALDAWKYEITNTPTCRKESD